MCGGSGFVGIGGWRVHVCVPAASLGVPIACVPTGVKHLHHEALHFDIGVYFEANGHGTVLFKPSVVAACTAARDAPGASADARKAAGRLVDLARLINQAVGDAVSDLLLVELVLSLVGCRLLATAAVMCFSVAGPCATGMPCIRTCQVVSRK